MFDQIRVTGEEITVSVSEEKTIAPLLSVYPNPVNTTTRVNFIAQRSGQQYERAKQARRIRANANTYEKANENP